MKSESLLKFHKIIPEFIRSYRTTEINKIPVISTKHDYFKNTFFLSTIIEWKKLNPTIRIFENVGIFKKTILTFISPAAKSIFNCHNPRFLTLLSRLNLGYRCLRGHKFKNCFPNSLNPFGICGIGETEISWQYLFHCFSYSTETLDLLDSIRNIDSSIFQKSDMNATQLYFLEIKPECLTNHYSTFSNKC